MSLIVKKKPVDYKALPGGTYPGRCVGVVGIGEQTEEFPGKPAKYVDQIYLIFEVLGEVKRHKDGTPYTITVSGKEIQEPQTVRMKVTRSVSQNAKLVAVWKSWFSLRDDDIVEIDAAEALGAPCLLNVQLKTSATGNEYNAVTAVLAPIKGMAYPDAVTAPYEYDIEDHDQAKFDALPEWIQADIKQSRQWAEMNANTQTMDVNVGDATVKVDTQTGEVMAGGPGF